MKIILKAAIISFLWPLFNVSAQENLTYQKPPKSIIDIVEAPPTPSVFINSAGEWMLILQNPTLPSVKEVSQPELRLAGLRINPLNNGQSRRSYYTNILLKSIIKNEEYSFSGFSSEMKISDITWSPDESKIAFSNSTADGIELWIGDIKTKIASKLSSQKINTTYANSFVWLPDGKGILAKFVDDTRKAVPESPQEPTGPVIQENIGKAAPVRTYQDMLKNPYHELLFDYYLSSKLKIINLNGTITDFSGPAIYRSFDYSPDGSYLLIEILKRPYSYLVPANLFPYTTEIYNSKGILIKSLYNAPLAENLPTGFDAVPTGPRKFGWRTDKPATIYWVEAKDNGDPGITVPIRDMIYTMPAPFTGAPIKLAECYLRFNKIDWSNDQMAIITERWWKTRAERRVFIKPGNETFRVNLFDFYYENTYSDPGDFITIKNEYNRSVLLTDKQSIYTIGEGSSPQGNRPFLTKFNTKTKIVDTLFHSQAPYYERPIFFSDKKFIITSRESVDSTANYHHVTLPALIYTPLTSFLNPYPQLKGIQKQVLNYKRTDGINLSGTLYLPEGYQINDGNLPVLIWAYPREFKTSAAANQVKGSPYQYTRISWGSPIYWVTRGYAVLDNADMPVIGESNKYPNDTFIDQIRYNAQAAINQLVEMGVADRKRIAVGGHSYGAFMTANLLAHTDLFAAGIARSGAYNRSLTPFGFQAEERTYWEAKDVYNKMSPFSYADKIKEPLLLIHGESDDNSGTFPIQSERFYNALKGHGAVTRLVLLPAEAHSYRARESILHMLWEMDQWLEKYVKNKPTENSANKN
ncbi:MAG: S9 family peptidase [Flavobacterium sp.]|nr:S9 family peptidase [Pedobacter sp.]